MKFFLSIVFSLLCLTAFCQDQKVFSKDSILPKSSPAQFVIILSADDVNSLYSIITQDIYNDKGRAAFWAEFSKKIAYIPSGTLDSVKKQNSPAVKKPK